MRYNILNICISTAVLLLCCACTGDVLSSGGRDVDGEGIINVGVDTEDALELSAITRAAAQPQDAEKVDWLVQPLMKGLDITYGNVGTNGAHLNSKVAILKLSPKGEGSSSPYIYDIDPDSKYAMYTFNYRSNTGGETANPALWYDNGYHFFEGVHVPNRLRYKESVEELAIDERTLWDESEKLAAVTDLTTDQHDDAHSGEDNQLGNYTLLAHYLGMPANTRIAATVARIKLPFRHRMARVLAYILIDPDLRTGANPAKIKGYKSTEAERTSGKDDPTTSSIRFCNVDVLGGVHDVYDKVHNLHTLTPTWAERVRKVVPHFQEEKATFKTYQSKDRVYFEGSSNFPSSKPAGFDEVTYHNVPVYDLIIRPTYTSAGNVMYDEDLGKLTPSQYAAKTNQIDFTVSLDNGLTYEKNVTIDLDANYQTIIYLRITHEGVDYNKSGSEKWVENIFNDEWYGVDNQNGNTLSKAGSSWQRAYYNRTLNESDKITDGGFYDERTEGEDGTSGQYVLNATWIRNFAQAYKGGSHHGDYFVLASDIEIDARSLPDDFVFTGHLDGFNTHYERAYHKIKVTGTNTPWKEYTVTTDYTSAITRYDSKPDEDYSDELGNVFVMPALYTKIHHDAVYYTQAECDEYNATLEGAWIAGEEIKEPATENVKYTQDEINAAIAIVSAEDYKEGSNPEAEETAKKTTDDVKIPGKPAVYYSEAECNEHNATLPGARTTATVKTEAYDEYVEAHPSLTEVMTGSTEYYVRNEDESYSEYAKPSVLYTMTQRKSGTALFAGLDGVYETNQEQGKTPWEANVHKEGSFWLPYRDVSDPDESKHTGWRAEVLNLTVEGCSLFKTDAVITGNVENCKDPSGMVADHTPAMPKYK